MGSPHDAGEGLREERLLSVPSKLGYAQLSRPYTIRGWLGLGKRLSATNDYPHRERTR